MVNMKVRIIKENNEYDEEDIYSEDGREELIEGDEISDFEEAFMQGYEEAG